LRVIVFAGGALFLAAVALNVVAMLTTAQEGGTPEEIEQRMMEMPVMKRGKNDPIPVIDVPPHVSQRLLVGWIPRKFHKNEQGRSELVLEARYTLDPTEIAGRLREEGCLDPDVGTGRRWEIRCAQVDRLRDVQLRQGDERGTGVLSWGSVEY
jgi:hypothetical protein